MPTKDEMDAIRLKYKAFSDDIIDKGKLGANRGLKISDKIRTFVLYITKSPDIKFVTKFQWDDFFQRAAEVGRQPEPKSTSRTDAFWFPGVSHDAGAGSCREIAEYQRHPASLALDGWANSFRS